MTCLLRKSRARFAGNCFSCVKLLIAGGIAAFASGSVKAALLSPRGADLFSREPTALAVTVTASKTVRLEWDFPVSLETPDLIFKVYHSATLDRPRPLWGLVTNVPGTLRSIELTADRPVEFFGLTASNYLGESRWATR